MAHSPFEIVRLFEDADTRLAFGHREHLFVAWTYLRSMPFEDALAKFSGRLKDFALASGHPAKFHATITFGYFALLSEAVAAGKHNTFDTLVHANPRLLLPPAAALAEHYPVDALFADVARTRICLPRQCVV